MTQTLTPATATPAQIDALWLPLQAREQAARDHAKNLAVYSDRYASKIAEYTAKADALVIEMVPFETEWDRRGGWTRYYLVQGPNGHLHRTMNCSTCFMSTRFSLIPDVSGLTDTEVVELAGERACTICFPDAPVSTLNRPTSIFSEDEKAAQVAREERAVVKAAKDAKAKAAAISNPDGTPLRGRWGVIKTERSAEIEVVDHLTHARAYDYSLDALLVDRIIDALAAKRSQTVEEAQATVEAKVAKKVAKARKEMASYNR